MLQFIYSIYFAFQISVFIFIYLLRVIFDAQKNQKYFKPAKNALEFPANSWNPNISLLGAYNLQGLGPDPSLEKI